MLLKCDAQSQSTFSQNGLLSMHWSPSPSFVLNTFLLMHPYFVSPAHFTIGHTRVQGNYRLRLIPSQLFPTPSFLPPLLPSFFPFVSQFRTIHFFSQCVLKTCVCQSCSWYGRFRNVYHWVLPTGGFPSARRGWKDDSYGTCPMGIIEARTTCSRPQRGEQLPYMYKYKAAQIRGKGNTYSLNKKMHNRVE